jgi:ABC-type nitrate/sulfonate/bicarbonate transport system substrate-binding protein
MPRANNIEIVYRGLRGGKASFNVLYKLSRECATVPAMANSVKPVRKSRFSTRSRAARSHAPAKTDRAATSPGRTIAAIDLSPIQVDRSPIPTATGIAHQLGWLEREAALDGTPLSVGGEGSRPQGAPPPPSLLRAAAPPDRLWEGDSTRALWERSEGRATRLIGLTWVETFQAVVALPGAGIAGPEQLAGRRLALPFDGTASIDVHRAAASRGLHAALGLAGIFPGEVAHVDVDISVELGDPYAAELAALTSGDVDAAFVAGAAGAAAAARIGAVTVASIGRHLDPAVRTSATTPAAIVVDAELLERQPNLVVRLLAVLMRAGAWAQLNARDATQLLALETGTSVRDVTTAHGANWSDQLHVDLSHRKLDALRAQADFLVTHGFLPRAVDLGAWIDPRPLGVARELLAAERVAWV